MLLDAVTAVHFYTTVFNTVTVKLYSICTVMQRQYACKTACSLAHQHSFIH